MTDDDLQLATNDDDRIEVILRSMNTDDLELELPPPDLWASIDAAARSGIDVEVGDEAAVEVNTTADNVIDLTSRFRRGATYFAAAASVVVLIGAAIIAVGNRTGSVEVVGEAELVWDEGFVAEGSDLAVKTTLLADGEKESVRIDEGSLPTRADEDLELWLIGVDDRGDLTIQTLGVIDGASGTYEVPADFDPDAFETVLVDISFEPRDGVETHSGASIVRGPIVDA